MKTDYTEKNRSSNYSKLSFKFLSLFSSRMCTSLECTTCGAMPFRTAVAGISNLDDQLKKVLPKKLLSYPNWSNKLRLIAIEVETLDWDSILNIWIDYADANVEFLDNIYFFIVSKYAKNNETKERWFNECLRCALEYKDSSLLESLILTQIPQLHPQSQLVQTAIEVAPTSYRLRRALSLGGFIQSDNQLAYALRKNRMQKNALENLPSAIRRRDVNALEAMLKWEPNIFKKLNNGISIQEIAESSECAEVQHIFNKYLSKCENTA